jgi:polysaccharide deacetylase family protein (PEP-CTERM system associated)
MRERESVNHQGTVIPMPMGSPDRPVLNALTVDVEDWYQSTYDRDAPIPDRVVRNTLRLLELFEACGVRATCFVLGLVCEKYPQLVGEIQAAGHEVATHGYSHRLVNRMSRQEFAEDLKRSLDLIQSATGAPVYGYRAPDFSIDADSFWALEVLIENGIRYDSSIFPIRNSRYGIRGWYRFPHRIEFDGWGTIIEFPLSTLRIGNYTFPFVGGGYSRLLPGWLSELGIRKLNQAGRSAVVYFHPYEINADEMSELGDKIPFKLRLSQGFNRKAIPSRLESLLRTLEFSTMGQVLGLEEVD